MLKNLFNRIKSEKQSTIKSHDKNQTFQHKKYFLIDFRKDENQSIMMTSQKETSLKKNLCKKAKLQQSIVKGSIKQVRYWTDEDIPDIFTRVLSCPISYFNLLPHSKRKVKEIDLKKDKFPEYLEFMKPLLIQQLPTYNHILINHYPKGIGIMHHFDGPLYNDRVIVLSLGGPAIISFQSGYSKQTQNMKILLEDKSIHIFQHNAYTKYLHGIQDKKIDAFTFTICNSSHINNEKLQNYSIKLKNTSNNESYFITECSIENLQQLHPILHLIENNLKSLTFEQTIQEQKLFCIEFCQNQSNHMLKGCFIFINDLDTESSQKKNDSKWKWKVQIQRQQRISITIRQKYQHTSNS